MICKAPLLTGYDVDGKPILTPCGGPAFGLLAGEPRCFYHLAEAARLQQGRAPIEPLPAKASK